MEERRFDDLTRALGRGVSRRTVLKGLVAGLFGGLLGGAVASEGTEAASPVCDQAALTSCIAQVERNYRWALVACIFEGSGGRACQGLARQARTSGYDLCNQTHCSCPEGTTRCGDAARGTCCEAGSTCHYTFSWFKRYSPSRCIKSCDPPCGACETCNDGTCIPLYCPPLMSCCNSACYFSCPTGQSRDPQTCACVDDGDGGYGGDCPVCQTGPAGSCMPDSSQDGNHCNACGHCSNGVCVPDPNQTCPTCKQCGAGGVCEDEEDNTACGSNEVCCGGTCTAGASCGPCPDAPDGHQCPPDLDQQQICCYGADNPCCADNEGHAHCGETNGVCCTVGTQIQCGQTCCDAATEQCSYYGDTPTGVCCPTGQVAVSNGTCCDEAQFCMTENGSICCPSGQQCATDPEQTVSICCAGPHADSDGQCCTEPTYYAHCTDDAYICCSSGDDETCCANHGGAA